VGVGDFGFCFLICLGLCIIQAGLGFFGKIRGKFGNFLNKVCGLGVYSNARDSN